MNEESITIIIGGDFVPTKGNHVFFQNEDIEGLIGNKCWELFKNSDLRVINLETPLSDATSPIVKWGPNLHAPVDSIKTIKKIGINIVGIANNHIMDQGVDGLETTIKTLDAYGIQHVGAGNPYEESTRVIKKHVKGKTIAMYACCENEFSTLNNMGANPFDIFETFDHLISIKESCDVLVVLFHGGIEQYRYPTPRMQKIAHKAIDSGADIFISQHSHCIGAYEDYKGKTIVYGQGNFIFDVEDNEFWNSGLLIKLIIKDKIGVEYIPIVRNGSGIVIADEKECNSILEAYEKRSEDILLPGFVEKNLHNYSKKHIYNYLRLFGGSATGNIFYRGINKITNNHLSKKTFGKKKVACILDYMRCESLNDFIVAGCMEILNENGVLK
ncbi:CapA family protein [Eubacterium xylanophilum]|uniref:CapA family protein n=1 Tax=Eubacterium xylanophilum TaxID=39497 RepID=UPI0004AC830D|nr:CapA family protein [Eubacterium xylanophilum]